jgi:hypothetical protein
MQDATEHWLPVVGYEGKYEIGDQGSVMSLLGRKPRTLTPIRQHAGHLMVNLYGGDTVNRHGWTPRFVHHLVLEAFVGPCPDGHVCRHLNGDPADNRTANLAWGTHSENGLDSVVHGTNWQARKTRCARGHEYTPENTYIYMSKDGSRRPTRNCRTCNNENVRNWTRRQRAARITST